MSLGLLGKKLIAIFVAITLVLTGIGFASVSSSEKAYAASSKKKVSVYVISKIVKTSVFPDDYGKFDTTTINLSYNKNGLITKASSNPSIGMYSDKISYKGKRVLTHKCGGIDHKLNSKFSHSGDMMTKSRDSSEGTTTTYKTNKLGQMTKAIVKYNSVAVTKTYVCSYDKKSRLKSCLITRHYKGVKTNEWKVSYVYDSKGYPKTQTYVTWNKGDSKKYTMVDRFTNAYKNGRLYNISIKGNGGWYEPTTYKYKKIKVTPEYAKLIKKQQKNYVMFSQYNVNGFLDDLKRGYL